MAPPPGNNPYESPRTERARPEKPAPRPRRGWFYRLALPSAWALTSLVSWYHPGDEYGLFFFSSAMPAIWVVLLSEYVQIGDMLWAILATSFVTMLLLGWAADALRVRRTVWIAAVPTIAAALVLWSLWNYPSYQRAMAKNGSLTAYVAAGLNLGLLAATLLGIVLTPVWRALARLPRS